MLLSVIGSVLCLPLSAGDAPPFPKVQAIPMPGRQYAFEVDGVEVARYHYDASYHRPFVFPLIGPAGRPLTRLTHPHDPDGHGHHLSIWVSHQNVNGADFWVNGDARILHEAIEKIEDGMDSASLTVRNRWADGEGETLLIERRKMTLRPLPDGERYLDVSIDLTPAAGPVTFGKTAFGFFAVRVAKTMSVNDGGGTLRNSEGAEGEKDIFWKPARWVDYIGRVTEDTENGLALFDHPSNPRFPMRYHVRGDGWMGASFCNEEPYELAQGETLTLHYRLYAHGPDVSSTALDARWNQWARFEQF